MDKKVRVRFAPSPTGPLHIGGVRTALYNYLFAKKNNGTFILRIEDTDQTRYVEGAEQYILDALAWAGMKSDEGIDSGGDYGPYRQSERKDLYKKYAEELVEKGHAYYAFDTPEELEDMRKRLRDSGVPSPQYNGTSREYMKNSLTLSADEIDKLLKEGVRHVIRIKVPRKEEVRVKDIIRGWVVFHSSQLDDKVIFKGDGMPTYHLANVVDDYLMKISHVIRGEEWLPSTPIHVLLYKYLGWEDVMPEFAHLPLILRPDGKGKLSKRDGDLLGIPVYPINWTDPETNETNIGYKETGFFPEAFVNILAFLGWNPGTEQEVFKMSELIEAFTIERIGKSGAKFDYDKAKWFNQQYLKTRDDADLAEDFKKILDEKGVEYEQSFVLEVCRLMKDRITFVSELWELGTYFFKAPTKYDEAVLNKKWKEELNPIFEEVISGFKALDKFDHDPIENLFKDILEKAELGLGAVLPVMRLMLSGMKFGPGVFEIAALLGKDETISRMETALQSFKMIKA
ncbi:MAG: glutamate--tRNA ligase [Bacteroidetes bacterium]|nr:glutamate--tRNA ligase [Bacteroidota bacterium]